MQPTNQPTYQPNNLRLASLPSRVRTCLPSRPSLRTCFPSRPSRFHQPTPCKSRPSRFRTCLPSTHSRTSSVRPKNKSFFSRLPQCTERSGKGPANTPSTKCCANTSLLALEPPFLYQHRFASPQLLWLLSTPPKPLPNVRPKHP